MKKTKAEVRIKSIRGWKMDGEQHLLAELETGKPQSDWEKKFDKKFYRGGLNSSPKSNGEFTKDAYGRVKDFIRSLLQQEKKRWVEEIRKTKNHFKGMVGAKKQYHAAEYMKYQILGRLNSLEEKEEL